MKKDPSSILRIIVSTLTILVITLTIIPAPQAEAASSFRQEFIDSYKMNRFDHMATLIKDNMSRVPGEVSTLMDEALAEDTEYAEKMYLLDIANTMASMHMHWNKDDGPLKEVEKVLKAELEKERARKAEIARWAAFERYPGNELLMSRPDKLKAAKVDPVVFPHWVHRLYYDCRVCHDATFSIKRTEAGMTHGEMNKGKFCGACHDGKTSFGVNAFQECKRCHNANEAAKKKLADPDGLDKAMAGKTAKKLGAGLNLNKLKFQNDKFGFLDWVKLRESGAVRPVGPAGKKPEARDTVILYKSTMAGIGDVPFNHGTHTMDIDCATCHPSVFTDKLGERRSTMMEMAEGKSCGACHNKVAFKLADCIRCHQTDFDKAKVKGKLLTRP
jgi:c(7)-type cytochrome triheme protein